MEKRVKLYRALIKIIPLLLIPLLIAIGLKVWDGRKYYVVSMGIMALSALPFILRFERRKPKARELVTLAVMIAMAVAGRAAFYMLPQFKPIAAIIIITGAAFGAEVGFITGASSGFISNFFFGQGPWTPWQMFGFAVIGFLAGTLFFDKKVKHRVWILAVYGGLATFILYGGIVDLGTAFMYSSHVNWKILLATYASGFIFNVIHGASTVIFLLLLSKPMLDKLERIKIKYGMLK